MHRFIAFVDESGDEGFDFSRSKRWFILCAAIYRAEDDGKLVALLDGVRKTIGKTEGRYYFHFANLKHECRVPLVHAIASSDVRIVCVRFDKHRMRNTGDWGKRGKLYWYGSKFLLERISWTCGDWAKSRRLASKKATVCFSNRASLRYDDLRQHLRTLKRRSEAGDRACNISWNVVDPDRISTLPAKNHAGLQIADAVCGAFSFAYEPRYGFPEDRYLKILEPVIAHDKMWP
jgi:hypothetical protein